MPLAQTAYCTLHGTGACISLRVRYTSCAGSEVERLAAELNAALHAALRGELPDHEAEIEGGVAEVEPPARGEELARRVEEIRQKYRPPGATGAARRRHDAPHDR